jgi:hypothetical protein
MEHRYENPHETDEIRALIARLAQLSAEERKEIAQALERLDTEGARKRMSRLEQALRKRKQCLRLSQFGAGVASTAFLAGMLHLSDSPTGVADGLFFTALLLALGFYGVMFVNMLRGEKPLQEAAGAMAGCDDLRAVGLLAETLRMGDPTHTLAVSALTRLLPRLKASDADLFDDDQRVCLYRALRNCANPRIFWRYNPHFAVTILRALEQVGDSRALPVVQRLASGRAKTPAQKRIQQAARECLPYLRLHATQQRDDQTLLRPGMDIATIGRSAVPREPQAQTETEAIEGLMAQLQEAVQQRSKTDRLLGATAAVGAATALLNLWLVFAAHGQTSSFSLPGQIALGCLALTMGLAFHGLYRMKNIASELVNAEDLRIVGPLAEMVVFQSGGGASAIATYLLTRLLPRLQASDADLLNTNQRACLYRSLTTVTNNSDYLIAALKALEQIGDGEALPFVERLAEGRQRTAGAERVQVAARDCLPYLRLRADKARASQTLLRASSASDTPPNLLLRPAQSRDDAEPEQLLRPGTPRVEYEEEPIRLRIRPSSPRDGFGPLFQTG